MTMKALIKHLIATNLGEIAEMSRLHCHAEHVHSVMLLSAPGKTIRLFVAEPGHRLDRNTPDMIRFGMSVGFHAHHCELTLVGVRGQFFNWTINVAPGIDGFDLTEFEYKSALRGEAGGFSRVGMARARTRTFRCIGEGESLTMAASEIHTVGTFPYQRDEVIAWLVFEGREDAQYDSRCWSTSDLTHSDLSGLYKPATAADVFRLLSLAQLL